MKYNVQTAAMVWTRSGNGPNPITAKIVSSGLLIKDDKQENHKTWGVCVESAHERRHFLHLDWEHGESVGSMRKIIVKFLLIAVFVNIFNWALDKH